MLLRVT